MQVDYYLPPDATGRAQRAHRLGYDGFFTAEITHDPFLPIAAAAPHQAGLDWGTAIAVAFARSPMVVAMTARDLSDVTGGRFLLGLGTQVKTHVTRRFGMDWDRPVARLRDYIGALRAVWDAWDHGTRLSFRGDFYQLTLMTPFFDPGPSDHGPIPVYIAGVGSQLSRLAGRVADGFHVHPFHTTAYLDQVVLPAIAAGAAESGRDPSSVQLVSTVFVVTGETEEQMARARLQVARQISFYASTPSYRPVLDTHGWDIGPTLTGMSKRGEWEAMAAVITDDVLEEIAVVAPLDQLGARIRERCAGRLNRVGYYSLGGDAELSDEQWTELIAATKT
jgi:probable F420-dependent oxidoreductase